MSTLEYDDSIRYFVFTEYAYESGGVNEFQTEEAAREHIMLSADQYTWHTLICGKQLPIT